MPTTVAQQQAALERANVVRMAGTAVTREIKAGVLTVDAALDDPRAAPVPLERLLMAQPNWGKQRVHRCLVGLRWATDGDWPTVLWPDLRVRDLTERQKCVLRDYLGGAT